MLGEPHLAVQKDTLVGRLDIGPVNVAVASMGFKHSTTTVSLEAFEQPMFTLKVIPHVDCTPRVLQLVATSLSDVKIHGAWEGPPALEVFSHAMNQNDLPVREVVSAVHVIADSTLGEGDVIKDYLAVKH